MELILLTTGQPRSWPLVPESQVIVGRDPQAGISIPDDAFMSAWHFVIEWDSASCFLRDWGSTNGTLVNGNRIQRIRLRDKDRISAGKSHFIVRLEKSEPTAAGSLRELLFHDLPVIGLLDAAANTELFYSLVKSRQKYESLYAGEQGEQLAAFGPCLIELEETNFFTDRLLKEGWGKAWCTYLYCSRSLKEVRHHLRRFLTVRTADGQTMYFRFYDPRILRQFLPTCSAEQALDFFGPITKFLVEGSSPETGIRLSQTAGRVIREEIAV